MEKSETGSLVLVSRVIEEDSPEEGVWAETE